MKILFRILKIVLIVIIVGVIIVGVFIALRRTPLGKKIQENNTEFYPDTSEAPVLELAWDGELDPKTATRYTPYGVWEGMFEYDKGIAYEPANEMQFYVKTDKDKYLASAPGIVTESELHGKSGLVTVRYGRNYAVSYYHIIPDPSIKIGQKIEVGDYLGKMEKMINDHLGEETWWEIQMVEYKEPYIRTVAPYQFFSQKSKQLLDDIVANLQEKNDLWITKTGADAWAITDGCSWLKHTPNWWSNFSRLGYTPAGAIDQSEAEFVSSVNPSWQVGDEFGRIIGPKDRCD